MADWKGRKVRIEVRKRLLYGSRLELKTNVFLDTDTMSDLFTLFDPKEHEFHIYDTEEIDR